MPTPSGPAVMLADTLKGWGLPMAADPMNHGALLAAGQIEALRAASGVRPGEEWAGFPVDSPEAALIRARPPLYRAAAPRRRRHGDSRTSATSMRARAPPRRRSAACSAAWAACPPATAW